MPSQESMWIEVRTDSYPIYVGHHLLSNSELFADYVANKAVFILSDLQVSQHYLSLLSNTCLQAKAIHVDSLLIPAGDHNKILTTAEQVWASLLSLHHYRDSIMIALGGGMIGDLAGFCAACYMRGMNIIHCPTTLLAQIDAAIGGKTGVNFKQNKNMIGMFHPPLAVFSDIKTLESLPKREFVAGLAELIKYGLSLDKDFFAWLEVNSEALLDRELAALEFAITRASQLKAQIVAQDQKEAHLRKILNFGHTIAHALESLLGYQLLHGEAVAIGMVVATRISVTQHNISYNVLERLIFLLKKVGLPIKIPTGITIVEILTKIKHDKKHTGRKLQWVLLTAIGKASLDDTLTSEQIAQALAISGAF